jgi:hypothetical protein
MFEPLTDERLLKKCRKILARQNKIWFQNGLKKEYEELREEKNKINWSDEDVQKRLF